MASTLIRNTAGQHFTFGLVFASTGQGDPGLTVTGFVTKDGGVQAPIAGIVTSLGGGQYSYAPTQAETDAIDVGFFFTAPGAVSINLDFHTVCASPSTPPWYM